MTELIEKARKALGPRPHPQAREYLAAASGETITLRYEWIKDSRFYQWVEENCDFWDGEEQLTISERK